MLDQSESADIAFVSALNSQITVLFTGIPRKPLVSNGIQLYLT